MPNREELPKPHFDVEFNPLVSNTPKSARDWGWVGE